MIQANGAALDVSGVCNECSEHTDRQTDSEPSSTAASPSHGFH